MHKLYSIVLSLLLVSGAMAATYTSPSTSFSDISATVAMATDGDTVIITAGTCSDWTGTINLTHGITLKGQTTTNSVAGTANDQTIILDNVVKLPSQTVPAILLSNPTGTTCRVSGFTFDTGTVTDGNSNGFITIHTATGGQFRIDNNHFKTLQYEDVDIQPDWYGAPGVIDHNVMEFASGNHASIDIRASFYANNADGQGDASWSDFPYFGSSKFVFIEDNYFNNSTLNEINGCIDGYFGGRWVFRHNHGYNLSLQTHGSENRYRGVRALEIYNNDFHYSFAFNAIAGLRTGVMIIHDNTLAGTKPGQGIQFSYLRAEQTFAIFLGASGDCAWDYNDTEGNGTHVDGHPAHLYDSGTVSSNGASDGSTVIDSSKTWTVNQWAGYSVKRVSDGQVGSIISNTLNTLTLGVRQATQWVTSDAYQIHQTLIDLDQPCRGKSDLIVGYNATPAWVHNALEPCYSWNNVHTDNTHFNFIPQTFIPPNLLQSGRDYFNDSSSAAMAATYVSGLNGVNYTGTYVYPHPLVGSGQAHGATRQVPSVASGSRPFG